MESIINTDLNLFCPSNIVNIRDQLNIGCQYYETDYLISFFSKTIATGLSSLVDGCLSHYQITTFLQNPRWILLRMWLHVKPMVRELEKTKGAGVIIFDVTNSSLKIYVFQFFPRLLSSYPSQYVPFPVGIGVRRGVVWELRQ